MRASEVLFIRGVEFETVRFGFAFGTGTVSGNTRSGIQIADALAVGAVVAITVAIIAMTKQRLLCMLFGDIRISSLL